MGFGKINDLREKYSHRDLMNELDYGRRAYHRGYTNAVQAEFWNWLCDAAYQRLHEYEESESRLIWTPFKERLPRKNQHILVTTFGMVTFGFVTSDPDQKLRLSIIDPINYQMTNADPYTYGIKAWMPLPAPYKRGDNNGRT